MLRIDTVVFTLGHFLNAAQLHGLMINARLGADGTSPLVKAHFNIGRVKPSFAARFVFPKKGFIKHHALREQIAKGLRTCHQTPATSARGALFIEAR